MAEYKSYRPEREREIIDHLEKAMERVGFIVEDQAKKNVSKTGAEHPQIKTGRLLGSITHRIEKSGSEISVLIGSNVEYACVIGSRQQIYAPEQHTSSDIGSYPFETILSKDGQPHKIITRHKFSPNSIEATAIYTREGRNPLIVTSNHLILISRSDNLIWETAQNIKEADLVFGKRSHNAITDFSNMTSFLCPCGMIFWREGWRVRIAKYCSRECRHKYGRHDLSKGHRWHLTDEQKAKHIGDKNPQWRGGIAFEPYTPEFNYQLKQIVRQRDGFQCQTCGSFSDLVVHHKDWDKTNSDTDNLITLCRSCHTKLNKQDCELPEVNLSIFVEKPIQRIEHYSIKRQGKVGIPHLYDFTIEGENSFVVSGILVHNSTLEFGKLGRGAHPPYPWLFPAVELKKDEIIQEIGEFKVR